MTGKEFINLRGSFYGDKAIFCLFAKCINVVCNEAVIFKDNES